MIAQELRIGNLAYYPTVNLNTGEQIFELIEITAKNILEHSIRPIYHPVPLTEEKLVEFGFVRQENNWKTLDLIFATFSWERSAGFALCFQEESIFVPRIKYVHQLQNFYFDLTGEELTLKTNDTKAN